MKELSIEQKAKRYEEALERARKIENGEPIGVPDGTHIPVAIFPELKKSDDERIVEEIEQFLKLHNAWNKEWFDWLEKQCEQKSSWSEEDEHRVKDAIYFLATAKKHYASTVKIDACIDWLKSLEQRIGGNHPNLTWEDIRKICLIAKNVHKYYGFWTQNIYEEILDRFNKPEVWT